MVNLYNNIIYNHVHVTHYLLLLCTMVFNTFTKLGKFTGRLLYYLLWYPYGLLLTAVQKKLYEAPAQFDYHSPTHDLNLLITIIVNKIV